LGPIAEHLSFCFSDHSFKTESDPLKVLAKPIAADCEGGQFCFVDAFDETTGRQRGRILSRVRDSSLRRILHLESETTGDNQWRLTDSLSLGYRRIDTGSSDQKSWSLYEFDIKNYKNTPDWLNADHWSNPQHWDRFRW